MSPLTEVQAAAIADLRAAFPDARLVVIGAVALGCHLPMTWRRTNDLDLTLAVEMDRLKEVAVLAGWLPDSRLPYRFVSAAGLRVDLLPTAQRHLDAGRIVFADTGQIMSLAGFDLALRHCREVPLPSRGTALVATVPAIGFLKMAAFLDRPHERTRDLEDLVAVFREYLGDDDDRRWNAPIVDSGVEYRCQPAFALGLDMAAIAEPSHLALVERFLQTLAESVHRARMVRVCPGPQDEREELLAAWFAAFRRGIDSGMR